MLKETYEVDDDLLLDICEVLRLNYIYVLMHTEHADELGEDFKPWKWEGCELDHAKKSSELYRRLIDQMTEQFEARQKPEIHLDDS